VRREPRLLEAEAPMPASGAPTGSDAAVASIEPLPGHPRKHFDEAALDELAASIAARGVIQPVIVRPHPEGEAVISWLPVSAAGARRRRRNFMKFRR
jgi:ParB family transcriptional regulator, chromosome partitioning protein